ncbi:MAG: metal ABC transporter substrate-binding protein [Abditibacteriales bacterium]|nr:metal ABC transporter substrate-binding protein [Abditibacteriales bacterium]MDW8365571.1 metal ABC transporter substrate-binding protein [Abditibacteriales bacterium]
MQRYLCLLIVSLLFLSASGAWVAGRKVRVITTNTTLADFVKQVGGDRVTVESLAKGTQDLHYIEPRPSLVTKLRDADMLVINGLAFDIWIYPLIDSARNSKVVTGSVGFVDASMGVKPTEVPPGKVSMAQGEVHPLGNPHYLLDPVRAKQAVKNILDGLVRVSPADAATFRANYDKYIAALDRKIQEWQKLMSPHKGKPVVTYHRSWNYFLERWGLDYFGTIEPKPAIPPSSGHVTRLMQDMKARGVEVILKEPYFPNKFPQLIAQETGAKLLVLPEWVGGKEGLDSYIQLMDYLVKQVADALS